MVAATYARLIRAFLVDRALSSSGPGGPRDPDDDHPEPLYVVELGAGSGRLAFLLLRALEELGPSLPLPAGGLVYVATDAARANVDAWRAHPQLAPYLRR